MWVLTMIKLENKKWLEQIGRSLVDVIFPAPEICPICHQEKSVNHSLGKNCFRRIALIELPICEQCGRPQRLEVLENRFCHQCRATKYYFSQARAVGLYDGLLREILAELKYRYRPELGEVLGKLLVEWVKLHREFHNFHWIVPIPINIQKLKMRGYNQAELLAKPLEKYLGIRLGNDIIIRAKNTESQNALSKEERFQNIKDAFRVVDASKIAGTKILLIDDILTTGATISEAARVLLRSGALEIKVLTVAMGIIDTQWFKVIEDTEGHNGY